jgi:pantetheine-phosphate adenylyltransferase
VKIDPPRPANRSARAKRIGIYPGTFDPFTNGHLDIVERAASLFDDVIVAVGVNLAKKTLFSAEERVAMIRESVAELANVRAEPFDGLQVNFARAHGARFVIRGSGRCPISSSSSRWRT